MSAPRNDTIGRLNYVEFSVPSIGETKAFYQKAFGWTLEEFGPTYAATVSGDVDVGLQADNPGGAKPPLPVIQVGNLETSLERTLAAGAVLIVPIKNNNTNFTMTSNQTNWFGRRTLLGCDRSTEVMAVRRSLLIAEQREDQWVFDTEWRQNDIGPCAAPGT
jgi:uncharacterized protein